MKQELEIPMPKDLARHKLYTENGCYCFIGWLCKCLGVQMDTPEVSELLIEELSKKFDLNEVRLVIAMEENDDAPTPAARREAFRRNCARLGIRVIDAPAA